MFRHDPLGSSNARADLVGGQFAGRRKGSFTEAVLEVLLELPRSAVEDMIDDFRE